MRSLALTLTLLLRQGDRQQTNITTTMIDYFPETMRSLNNHEFLLVCFCPKRCKAPRLCWLTVLMRVCHTSMKTGEEVLTRLAFWVQAGHSHSGMDNMAMAGVTKANVPPCRMGSLQSVTQTVIVFSQTYQWKRNKFNPKETS